MMLCQTKIDSIRSKPQKGQLVCCHSDRSSGPPPLCPQLFLLSTGAEARELTAEMIRMSKRFCLRSRRPDNSLIQHVVEIRIMVPWHCVFPAQGSEAATLRKSTQEINGRLGGAERKSWGVQCPFYASVTIRHVSRLSVAWTDLKRRCQCFPFNLFYLVRTLVILIKNKHKHPIFVMHLYLYSVYLLKQSS